MKTKKENFVIISILILLRLLLIIPIENSKGLMPVYEDFTYLVVGIFLFRNKKLAEWAIDKIAVFLFLFLPIISSIVSLVLSPELVVTVFIRMLMSIVYIVLSWKMVIFKDCDILWFKKIKIHHVFLFLGLIMASIVLLLIQERLSNYSFQNKIPSKIILLINQLLNAGIPEEFLFRSLIIFFLLNKGIRKTTTNIIQALLFTLGHLYYFMNSPVSLFIVVPISGYFFGLIVMYYKKVSYAIIAHGVFNTSCLIVLNYFS